MGQGQAEEKKGKKVENKVVLKVDMDCEACKQKVRKVLKKFPGVEDLNLDVNEQMVTVKGNVDAYQVYEALRKKCGKRTMLVYPPFSKEDEKRAKEDAIINSVNKIVDSITDLLNPKPADTIVELKVRMHCGACAKKIKRILLRMDGVMEVDVDQTSDKVVVKGRDVDAQAVCDWVRDSGKHCEVVSIRKEEKTQEKKKGEKNEDKKVEDKGEKEQKSDEKQEKTNGGKKAENKGEKEEKSEEKKDKKEEKQDKKNGGKKAENKGENKEEKRIEKKEENKGENKKERKDESKNETEENKETKMPSSKSGQEGLVDVEVKKDAYTPYQSVPEYVYAPQIFSDENPNACTLM